MMEGVNEERREETFLRKNSGKAFKSRKHDKAEKLKRRKKWLKKKCQAQRQKENPVQQDESPIHEEPAVEENCEVQEETARKEESNVAHVSRGKRLVELSKQRKRKNDEELKTRSKVPKPTKGEDDTKLTAPCATKRHNFKELDRELLNIDEGGKIGSGTFGRCFTGMYCNQYRVVVKEMKVWDSSKKESEHAKQEASVLVDLGDHPGLPIYLVCILYLHSFI